MSALAPVVVFAYKRVEHARSTIEALERCEGFADSELIVYADGAKSESDREAVAATRRLIQERLGSRAEYHFRDHNFGLAASIIDGVSEVTRRFGRAIVIEDDLKLSTTFLSYMNNALDRYAEEPKVWQISGHMFDTPELRGREDAVFLPFTTSWGWGTWHRAWENFDPSASGWELLADDTALRRRFNLDGVYDFATMLERQMRGHSDSWAVRWYWSVFRANGLVCFPPESLVRNTGMDGSGTHGRGVLRLFRNDSAVSDEKQVVLPPQVIVNTRDFDSVKAAIWRQNGGWLGAAADQLRRCLNFVAVTHT